MEQRFHKDRALWAAAALLFLVVAAVMLRETGGAGWMPGCAFRSLTGLECPGCGMTRATYALLHGDFITAVHFNPVGIMLVPLLMLAGFLEMIGWVRGKPLPVRLNPGKWGGVAIVLILMIWWVGRNLW